MTPNYFIWNGVDSRAMGVFVIKYPPIIRAQERLQFVTVPGRAGDLTLAEGEKIYDAYDRSMEVSNMRGADINAARAWLSGSGQLIMGNEPDFVYTVNMNAQLQMDKIIRGVWGGVLTMHTQPFKAKTTPQAGISITVSGGTVYNPGDVPAKPVLGVHCTPSVSVEPVISTLTIGGKTLSLENVPEYFTLDLENQWTIDSENVRGNPSSSGDFGSIPPGNSIVSFTGDIDSVDIPAGWWYL